jgi:Tfp pilus assembly ATPase PilU
MQTLNDALYALYVSKDITAEEALRVTSAPTEFLRMIGRATDEHDVPSSPATRPQVASGGRR